MEMWKTVWKTCALLFLFGWTGCGGTNDEGAALPEEEFDSLAILAERRLKDSLFRVSETSPIPPSERKNFRGLRYYEPTREYVVPAVLQLFETPDTVLLPSTMPGEVHPLVRYGVFHIAWGDTVLRLTVFKPLEERGVLFVPFKDATTGKETYAGGRYLEVPEVPGEEEYWLDFNRAYNPYCAYNRNYACPVVPPENVLPIPIRAGEKVPAYTHGR